MPRLEGHAELDPAAGSTDSSARARTLLRGGAVLSMDPSIGNFARADILIENGVIAAVQPQLDEAADADGTQVIDVSDSIVIPGFVDTHRHCWQNQLRRLIPSADLLGYKAAMHFHFGRHYTPHDMYVGSYLSALSAMDSGVTCLLDWSHNSRTPEHSDAVVEALFDSGIRGVYCFGSTRDAGCPHKHPHDIGRLKSQYFSSNDQLVTLAMGIGMSRLHARPQRHTQPTTSGEKPDMATAFALAREYDVEVSLDGVHGVLAGEEDFASQEIVELARAGHLGPRVTYVHCNGLADEAWQAIADTGGTISVAATSETQLGLATSVPVTQDALRFGIRPSLSVDVETALSGDFFSQMRAVYHFQRSDAFGRRFAGEADPPAPITVEDVLGFATVEGARANGLSDRIGTLTPGKAADLVCITRDDLNTMPFNNAAGTVVLGADTRNVDTVVIDGHIRKFNGRLVNVDLARLRAMVYESRNGLIERSGYDFDVCRMTDLETLH